jgi:3-deoxy-D-manno-octulosonic-acid transferase
MAVFLMKMFNLTPILYDIFIKFYLISLKVASFFNAKAKKWVDGRRNFPALNNNQKKIWVHCASLGEFEQGRPILEKLKQTYPDYPIVLTFFSPSGYEIRKNYTGADYVFYLPIDTQKNATKFIQEVNPALVVWVKYEYWFHYLNELKKQSIPILLVSAIFRQSQPFFKSNNKFWKKILVCFDHIFVQDVASKELLNRIDVSENITVSGDTRFDRVLEIAAKKTAIKEIESFIENHHVLIAGSTWEQDEKILAKYMMQHENKKLIIAPHEIDAAHLKTIKQLFPNSIFYSEWVSFQDKPNNIQVLIIDNMGMLSKLYQYATICYIGGGFNKSGIHNILEAAVYGKAIVFGPHYQKFGEAVRLIQIGGAFSIQDENELSLKLDSLFADVISLKNAEDVAKQFAIEKSGATKIIVDYVEGKRLLTNASNCLTDSD